MDINIKYKEIDIENEVMKQLQSVINNMKEGFCPSVSAYAKSIDAIYKEDSKKIESVEIKHFVVDEEYQLIDKELRHGFKWGNEGSMEYITKSELSQYINLLQQIHEQMEG